MRRSRESYETLTRNARVSDREESYRVSPTEFSRSRPLQIGKSTRPSFTGVPFLAPLPRSLDRKFRFDSLFAIEIRGNALRVRKDSQSDLSFRRTRFPANKEPLSPQYPRGIHHLKQLFWVQPFARSGQVRSRSGQAKAD